MTKKPVATKTPKAIVRVGRIEKEFNYLQKELEQERVVRTANQQTIESKQAHINTLENKAEEYRLDAEEKTDIIATKMQQIHRLQKERQIAIDELAKLPQNSHDAAEAVYIAESEMIILRRDLKVAVGQVEFFKRRSIEKDKRLKACRGEKRSRFLNRWHLPTKQGGP